MTSSENRRLHLIEQILCLPEDRLEKLERFLQTLSAKSSVGETTTTTVPAHQDWPHAPLHRLSDHGTYIVTAGTYLKAHLFGSADRLDHLQNNLLARAKEAGWQLEAWAIFSNHYHFIGHAGLGCEPLSVWLKDLHYQTATHVNQLDEVAGRQVWFNYLDTQLTYEKSYLARLNYVHQNAVKHGLVRLANQYRWCSAGWFEQTATRAQVRTIYGFKIDRVHVEDEFDPV